MKKFKLIWNITFSLALISFSVYALMDVFFISRVVAVVDDRGGKKPPAYTASIVNGTMIADQEEPSEKGKSADESGAGEDAVVSETSYKDEHISITISEYEENETTIHVADIKVDDPSYLKTAFAKSAFGKNVTAKTSETAEEVDAILAINGDYYGVQESGYVIREGKIYRDTAVEGKEDLAIYEDGSFQIINETEVSAQSLLADGVVNLLSFGPGLIKDGEISVSEYTEVARARSSNPRTALGMIEEGHYVFVVSDGRTEESEGLSLYELAAFMDNLGCKTAYNLDGGGSSTMVFSGTIVNTPTGGGHGSRSGERAVSDIVYIGY